MTLSDVAAAAGVSPSTASRVLNGGKPVSGELDARVRDAAARVGYVSNAAASAMRGRQGLIAILTDELGAEALAELAIAAGQSATAAGLTTTVSSAGTEPQQQLLALRVLRSLRPRSLVLAGGWVSEATIRGALADELAEFVHHDGGDVVVMGPAVLPYPTVSFDDHADGLTVAAHMAAGGGSSAVVLAGPASDETYRGRAAGLVDGLQAAGVRELEVIHSENDSAAAEAAIARRGDARAPDMILCVSDRLALGAYAAIDGLGLRLPADVAVSGIDDLPVSRSLEPSLTTVAHPLGVAGALVVELALNGAAADYRRVLPGELVVRSSSRPPVR